MRADLGMEGLILFAVLLVCLVHRAADRGGLSAPTGSTRWNAAWPVWKRPFTG
jgi:hypothetical protein